MDSVYTIVAGGVALGFLQLSVGVGIGLWLGRRREAAGGRDQERAARLAAELRGLTDSVASSVRRHNAAIESIDRRLRDETGGLAPEQAANPLTNLVVGVVAQMLQANQQLQRELIDAEEDLKRQAEQLDQHRQEALTDALTGLPNRRAFDDHLRARLQAWRTHRAPFCVMLLDVDHFKRFNDTHGHQAGDRALFAFGEAVSGSLRKQDVVCRHGGEEFAVLLPHTTLSEARGAVEKVRQAISDLRFDVDGKQLSLTASGGLACIAVGESSEFLVARADEALYAAKTAGRNRVYRHDGVAPAPLDEPAADEALVEELSEEVRDACTTLRAGLDQWITNAETPAGSR